MSSGLIEKAGLCLFIAGKIIQFIAGEAYYVPRNLIVRTVGVLTKKGSREDHTTGSPHNIYYIGRETFEWGGRE